MGEGTGGGGGEAPGSSNTQFPHTPSPPFKKVNWLTTIFWDIIICNLKRVKMSGFDQNGTQI